MRNVKNNLTNGTGGFMNGLITESSVVGFRSPRSQRRTRRLYKGGFIVSASRMLLGGLGRALECAPVSFEAGLLTCSVRPLLFRSGIRRGMIKSLKGVAMRISVMNAFSSGGLCVDAGAVVPPLFVCEGMVNP